MYPYRNILTLIHQNMKCHRFTISYYIYNHDDICCWIQNNTSDKVYKHIVTCNVTWSNFNYMYYIIEIGLKEKTMICDTKVCFKMLL